VNVPPRVRRVGVSAPASGRRRRRRHERPSRLPEVVGRGGVEGGEAPGSAPMWAA
jgi:hypothetical protein